MALWKNIDNHNREQITINYLETLNLKCESVNYGAINIRCFYLYGDEELRRITAEKISAETCKIVLTRSPIKVRTVNNGCADWWLTASNENRGSGWANGFWRYRDELEFLRLRPGNCVIRYTIRFRHAATFAQTNSRETSKWF